MSIATAITNLQGKIANAYTAIENKGGTLPATQNAENLSATIDAIPGGGTKFGLTIDDVLTTETTGGETTLTLFGDVTEINMPGVTNISGTWENMFTSKTKLTSVSFPNLKDAPSFRNTFNGCSNLSSISFPELSSVSNSWYAAFRSTNLASVSFPNLKNISGSGTFENAFNACTNLTTVSFPELTSVVTTGSFTGFASCFDGCTKLTSVSFPKLAEVNGLGMFRLFVRNTLITSLSFPALSSIVSNVSSGTNTVMFYGNTNLTRIDFPSLTSIKKASTATSNNLLYLFNNCTNLVEIHFGAANQAVIEASDGYATKWGAPNANCQIYFDL